MTLILTAGLARGAVYDFTQGNKLTLLQSPHEATDLKLDLVRHAKHHIHIVTYYWDDKGFPIELMKELRNAHARGVEVRLMSTLVPSLTLDPLGKAYRTLDSNRAKKENPATIAYLRLAPGNNESWTNNIHEKIFLVDGKVAIIGGRNISDNDYRAKDLEVKIQGPVVNQVQEHFQKLFDFLVDLKIIDDCKKEKDLNLCKNSFNQLRFAQSDKNFYPVQPQFKNGSKARILTNDVLFAQYKNHYQGKNKFLINDDIINTVIKINFNQLRAYNYFILPTDLYRDFLLKNISDGKDVRMISNSLSSSAFVSNNGYLMSLPGMKMLVDNGLEIAQWTGTSPESKESTEKYEYLHEKVMLFDDNHGIIGSHNYGLGSTSVSSEICIEFFNRPIVETLNEIFDREYSDRSVTTIATSESLQNEIAANKTKIRILEISPIQTILKMLY